MTESVRPQTAGFHPLQAFDAIERNLSQGIAFNEEKPVQGPLLPGEQRELLTGTQKASNIFKAAFNEVDSRGASAAQTLFSSAQELAGRTVTIDTVNGTEHYNIGGIAANGIAALLATLVRVAFIALAALAGAGAVILEFPATLIRDHRTCADQAAQSKTNVALILMHQRISGTANRQTIENSLKFIEQLVLLVEMILAEKLWMKLKKMKL